MSHNYEEVIETLENASKEQKHSYKEVIYSSLLRMYRFTEDDVKSTDDIEIDLETKAVRASPLEELHEYRDIIDIFEQSFSLDEFTSNLKRQYEVADHFSEEYNVPNGIEEITTSVIGPAIKDLEDNTSS